MIPPVSTVKQTGPLRPGPARAGLLPGWDLTHADPDGTFRHGWSARPAPRPARRRGGPAGRPAPASARIATLEGVLRHLADPGPLFAGQGALSQLRRQAGGLLRG